MGVQSAVTSDWSEDGDLLVTLEVVHLVVRWRVVLGMLVGVEVEIKYCQGAGILLSAAKASVANHL